MPSSPAGRLNETQCPVCLELVGAWFDRYGLGMWKIARHHDGSRRWCTGSGQTVSAGAVIPC